MTTTANIKVERMEARARALSLLSSRLATFTLDAPARPVTAEADPFATVEAVENWQKAEALLALMALVISHETFRQDLGEAIRRALELGALERHSPAHLAVADVGARL